jgi:hypothetical protein
VKRCRYGRIENVKDNRRDWEHVRDRLENSNWRRQSLFLILQILQIFNANTFGIPYII